MSPRVAATLALLLGGSLWMFYLARSNEGPFVSAQGRHLSEMKRRRDLPARVVPATFADFAALPHARPLREYAPLERRAVSLVGYPRWMFASPDGDYHVDLSPAATPERSVDSLPVTAEITPEWHRGSPRWRWEQLAAAFRPNSFLAPPWPGAPRRVRVSGWLLYDFEYDAPYGAPRRPLFKEPHGRRLTGWEIHPVTRIELWDESRDRFVEYPR